MTVSKNKVYCFHHNIIKYQYREFYLYIRYQPQLFFIGIYWTKVAKKSSLFLGGVAFGTLGLKVLASKEAKKGYSKALAKAYKLKDGLDASVSVVKQHGDDVLQDAKYLYEQEKKEEQLDSLTGE